MYKKFLTILMALFLSLSLIGCSSFDEEVSSSKSSSSSISSSISSKISVRESSSRVSRSESSSTVSSLPEDDIPSSKATDISSTKAQDQSSLSSNNPSSTIEQNNASAPSAPNNIQAPATQNPPSSGRQNGGGADDEQAAGGQPSDNRQNTPSTAPIHSPDPENNNLGENTGNANNFNTYDNPEQQQTTASYVLNTNTMKFHYPGCRSVKKIAPENYETFDGERSSVIAQGYDPCGICKP